MKNRNNFSKLSNTVAASPGSNLKTPSYLIQKNKLLNTNLMMQDKLFELKNYLNQKCIDASKKLNSVDETSVEKNDNMWSEEYHVLITDLLDGIIDTKMDQ